ncbi:MAG: response regulator [Alphaproteobacteria bacterium]|nr:response regulator [Alphaproteobacteria bacterium]
MGQDSFINILIAEDNDVSREMMAAVLRTHGYNIYGAIDGESAIKVVEDRDIDLALVDINMAPKGGLDFIRWLVSRGLKIPVVVVTADDSTHVLVESASLGVTKVIHKPIDPDKLVQAVDRILKRRGFNPQPMGVEKKETRFSPEDLMKKAIALAARNAQTKHGGPFAALVADKEGHILGEGTAGRAGRVDPTAHAEVMAIRQAAEKLGRADLSDCILYCSGEPTMMGKALITSVGIRKVYYGLSHADVAHNEPQKNPEYTQTARDQALAMYKEWKKL